jgi:crossover junction endodeoxyribonuclease RusA
MTITIRVDGNPAPQGSKSFKGHASNGRAILVESSSRLKPWRAHVGAAARNAMRGQQPFDGPIHIDLEFVMPRPKNTPKTRSTPPATKRPDIDKLARAVLDAITAICYHDDSQVTHLNNTKRIAEPDEPAGVTITIKTAEPPTYCLRCGIPHTTECKRGTNT